MPAFPAEERAAPDWPCGLLITDPAGLILDVNETLLRWTGYDRESVVGCRRLRDLFTVGGRIFYETHIGPLLAMQGEVSEVAVDVVGARGVSLPVLLNASSDEIDGVRLMRFAVFPATQRRSYERELLEARRSAEQARAASERVQRRLSLMADVNLVLSGTLDLPTALERLATVLSAERDERCIILTLDDEHPARALSVVAAAAADEAARELAAAVAESLAWTGVNALRALFTHARPHAVPALTVPLADGRSASFGPAAVVPVRVRERQVATLLLARRPDQAPYSTEDLAGLAALGEPIGLFIDNLRLYAREHSRAVALQEALLTTPVAVPGLDIISHYLPSADGAMVGGDWYDSLVRPDGSVVVTIGDVTGHDHNAAAAMGQLRGLLRAVAYIDDGAPADVLAATDRAARGLGVGCLATAVVVEFGRDDAGATTLTWANAGHLPPVLVTSHGDVELLGDAPELMLGVDPRTARHNHVRTLAHGDTLVLYTDGLVENRYRSLGVGLDTLVATLGKMGSESSADIGRRLISEMSGGRGGDDIAVLTVRVT